MVQNSWQLPESHVGDSGSYAPVGAEGVVCASQHGAAICGVLPREVEVCVVPNAGWQVHLNICLQGNTLSCLCAQLGELPPRPSTQSEDIAKTVQLAKELA